MLYQKLLEQQFIELRKLPSSSQVSLQFKKWSIQLWISLI